VRSRLGHVRGGAGDLERDLGRVRQPHGEVPGRRLERRERGPERLCVLRRELDQAVCERVGLRGEAGRAGPAGRLAGDGGDEQRGLRSGAGRGRSCPLTRT
jgi:hypothetical protein